MRTISTILAGFCLLSLALPCLAAQNDAISLSKLAEVYSHCLAETDNSVFDRIHTAFETIDEVLPPPCSPMEYEVTGRHIYAPFAEERVLVPMIALKKRTDCSAASGYVVNTQGLLMLNWNTPIVGHPLHHTLQIRFLSAQRLPWIRAKRLTEIVRNEFGEIVEANAHQLEIKGLRSDFEIQNEATGKKIKNREGKTIKIDLTDYNLCLLEGIAGAKK